MKITNRHNLPEPFVVAFGADDYDRGTADHTTTELIKPVRIRAFNEKYFDEMEEDVSDRVWRFFGGVKHLLLQRIAEKDPERYLVEKRVETTMPGTGETVSGRVDLFDRQTEFLYDYKETSVWKFMLGDTEEWEEQANINCYLLRQNNIYPKKLLNVAWLKDWKVRKARLTGDDRYPKCAIHVVELPRWTIGEQQDFILKRALAYDTGHDDPPVCTPKERWEMPARVALMKKGRKAAVRLYDERDQAEAVLNWYKKRLKPGEQFFLEERPTEPRRCLDHCPVQKWCDFGQEAAEKWRNNE